MRKFKLRESEKNDITSALGLIAQIGLNMVITIIITIMFGNWLDGKAGTSPLFLVIFVVLGIGAAFRNLFVMTMKMAAKDKDDTKEP